MFTTLFAIEVAASVAIAICAIIAAHGRRCVAALCGFAIALLADANALTLPGHRNWWGATALLVCGAVLLGVAVVVAFRPKPQAHDPASCRADAEEAS